MLVIQVTTIIKYFHHEENYILFLNVYVIKITIIVEFFIINTTIILEIFNHDEDNNLLLNIVITKMN